MSTAFVAGDRVRIVANLSMVFPRASFDNEWVSQMDNYVNDGNTYVVSAVNSFGVELDGGYYFPPESLELVDDSLTTADDNDVGC